MPWLLALGSIIINLLRQYLPGILGRVLLAFGIGFAAHSFAVEPMLNLIQAQTGSLPAVLAQTFSAIGMDKVITMIFSAYAAKTASNLILSKRPT